jgi:NAD+ kinase
MPEPVTSVGLVVRPESAEALAVAGDLAAELARRGVPLRVDPGLAGLAPSAETGEAAFVLGADLVLAFGGDGTLLGVARAAAPLGTLVLGVDVGSFGFLAEEAPAAVREGLDDVLAGRCELDERMMLEVEVRRGEEVEESYLALNDAVVARATYRHLARLRCEVDGHHLATYPADGLIVATPTGSTAYNLSAGGPIVDPTVDCFLVAAICPHTLYSRPLVVDAGRVMEIRLEPRPGRDDALCLTADGLPPRCLEEGERVVIRRAACRARLVHLCRRSFFDRLRDKLSWGAPR